MRAFYVIGVDLELGLGEGAGIAVEQEVVALLVGLGLLCVREDVDQAVEVCGGAVVQDALEQLAAVTFRYTVQDIQGVGYMRCCEQLCCARSA